MFSNQSVTQNIIWTTFKMSSTNASKLDWFQILLFGKELSLYLTIQSYNISTKEGFWNHWGKRRKCQHFLFSYNVFRDLFPKIHCSHWFNEWMNDFFLSLFQNYFTPITAKADTFMSFLGFISILSKALLQKKKKNPLGPSQLKP